MIKCSKCGHLNEFDRVLCISCGMKLDFNNPDLVIHEEKARPEPSLHAKDFKLESPGLSKSFFIISFIFIISLSLIFMLQTNHISQKELKLSSAESLEKKLIILKETSFQNYISFNEDECNLYIERKISNFRSTIVAKYPKFIKFEKCFIKINDIDITIYIVFNIANRKIILSLRGDFMLENKGFLFHVNRIFVGKHIIPSALGDILIKNIKETLSNQKLLDFSGNISQLKIFNNELYFLSANQNSNLESSSAKTGTNDINLPDDILLVQAADNYFWKEQYTLAWKYYNLAMIRYRETPLAKYIREQINLCKEKL
ncbi:MAG: hypothetical protein ACD_79C00263G0002 [uncultured bacterium]|nr:MAG: hypothetical protein ACD_79C00263G0002 [uncultured bacterium]